MDSFSARSPRDFTFTSTIEMTSVSTPPLNRLDSLESPLRRYSGRRVVHIDVPASPAPTLASSPSLVSSSISSATKAKSARQLHFASSPAPVNKRSRSVENSDDDEFALAVASDSVAAAFADESPIRVDDVSTNVRWKKKKEKFKNSKNSKKLTQHLAECIEWRSIHSFSQSF